MKDYLGKLTLQFAIEKGNLDIDLEILILMICLFKFILLQTYVECIRKDMHIKWHEILNYWLHDNRIDVNLIESKELRYFHYTREKKQLKTPLFVPIEMNG